MTHMSAELSHSLDLAPKVLFCISLPVPLPDPCHQLLQASLAQVQIMLIRRTGTVEELMQAKQASKTDRLTQAEVPCWIRNHTCSQNHRQAAQQWTSSTHWVHPGLTYFLTITCHPPPKVRQKSPAAPKIKVASRRSSANLDRYYLLDQRSWLLQEILATDSKRPKRKQKPSDKAPIP